MKKTILAAILTLFLALPLGIADHPFVYFPSTTSSPMVKVPTPQSRYINAQDLNLIREGLPVIVYGQVPETEEGETFQNPETQLMIDEYGVLVNAWGEPVVRGTTGYSFAHGYDWTRLHPWTRYGSYFTSNLRGFKASAAQTHKLKDYGGRTWGVYMYNGYGPARAVIKQWYRPRGTLADVGYVVPGVTNMVTDEPVYIRPGIPSYITPDGTEESPLTSSTAKIVERNQDPTEEKDTAEETEAEEVLNMEDDIVIE
ncbi:MAG TPA: hypothetical protein VJG90_01750 [Candidatus Nanoarchaeia archaeon]|nr:hypothetical protein [Candidatus Nanoarchaeia archaeon]